MTLLDKINKEQHGGIFLPHIQRDFVWREDKIYTLMDSLMRGYPVGSFLTWETFNPINYRSFITDYVSDFDFESEMHSPQDTSISREYVLDGQQRLQSLYIALHGSYEGKELYFKITSSPKDENGYEFCFMRKPEGFWVNVKELVCSSPNPATLPTLLKNRGIIDSSHKDEECERMSINAIRLHDIFHRTSIPVVTMRQSKNIEDEIGIDEVANIFVRINSEGVVLEKADLLMAMIKTQSADIGFEFSKINAQLENMGFSKTRDFVLRAFQTMMGLGTELQISNFSNIKAQKILEDRISFAKMKIAVCKTLEFIANFKFIGGPKHIPCWNPILLLICARFYHPEKWDNDQARAFLLFAFLTKAFTSVGKKTMNELVDITKSKFDLQSIKAKIGEKNRKLLNVGALDLIEKIMYKDTNSVHLILRLLTQGKLDFPVGESLQIDHIFPIKLCKKRKIKAAQYNQLANLTLLIDKDNNKKLDMSPSEWFNGRAKEYLDLHFIPQSNTDILDIKNFDDFINQRKAMMSTKLSEIISTL